jgi:hypothetical protein
VGTAFFILILLTGYFYYTLMTSDIAAQERVQSEMRSFDIERAQEKIVTINVEKLGDDIVVTLKNSGSRPVTIKAIGYNDFVFATWNYNPSISIDIDPLNTLPWVIDVGNVATFRIHTTGLIADPPAGAYKVQFLTEKGLVYTVGYP